MRVSQRRLLGSYLGWMLFMLAPQGGFAAEETYTLEESAGSTQVFQVNATVHVRGKLKTAAGQEKTLDLDLAADASFAFRERRLPGAGRDALALRSLREYETAQATILVNRNKSFSELAKPARLIVANGQREGLVFYQPQGLLTRNELELLQMPGDGLAVLGFLPQSAVSVGKKWTVENWAVQMLTGTEALLKNNVSCELESVKNDLARVRFEGQVEGATQGATTEIKLAGHYVFDTKRRYLRHVELTQTEKRGVGAVSPGMDVTATVKQDRSPAVQAGRLTESAVEAIALEPDDEQLHLTINLPWNATLRHARAWHVFQHTANLTVLRLVKTGGLIAQCNLSPLPDAAEPLSEPAFRELVRKGLGESFKSIARSQRLPTDNELFLYRVIAKGESQKIDMTWHYYLAAAGGRQMLFFFAFETELEDKLDEEDLSLVKTLEFVKPELIPAGR